jgi:uncharacterized membrane protein YqhA
VDGGPGEQAETREVPRPDKSLQLIERALALSRLAVLIPVVFLLLDALAAFVYGTAVLISLAAKVVSQTGDPGIILGRILVILDGYLVGATLMIAAFGFYELFIVKNERADAKFWLPTWLKMTDLHDLEARVVSMLILVAAATFVDVAVETQDEHAVFFLGLGVAVVALALTAFLRFGRRPSR